MTADPQPRSPQGLLMAIVNELETGGFDMIEGDLYQRGDDGTEALRPVTINIIGQGPTPPPAVAKAMTAAKDRGYIMDPAISRSPAPEHGPGKFEIVVLLIEDPIWPPDPQTVRVLD